VGRGEPRAFFCRACHVAISPLYAAVLALMAVRRMPAERKAVAIY
jgi:hypothetical protein